MENNQGSVTGVLQRITPYTTKKNRTLSRLDVLVPSVSPLDHPTMISIHSEGDYGKKLNTEVTVSYRAMTFLKAGTGAGADQLFDQTRLEEIAA